MVFDLCYVIGECDSVVVECCCVFVDCLDWVVVCCGGYGDVWLV